MKILAIPASNSPNGLNRQLLAFAAKRIQEEIRPDVTVEVLDLNQYELPIYSGAREAEGIPELVHEFLAKIGEADAVMVSYAEHNGSFSVAWKNIYDWASRITMQVFQGKKVAMFAATPGGRGGASVLHTATSTAAFFGADLVGSVGVGSFHDVFDQATGELTDDELRTQFDAVLKGLFDTEGGGD